MSAPQPTGFNLSDWALRHKSFVVFLMLISAIAGLYCYGKLGREEDPPFTIKVMVIKTLWPGATTNDTLQQVTDRRRCPISISCAATRSQVNPWCSLR
mgnify:CR=1 FL=1